MQVSRVYTVSDTYACCMARRGRHADNQGFISRLFVFHVHDEA